MMRCFEITMLQAWQYRIAAALIAIYGPGHIDAQGYDSSSTEWHVLITLPAEITEDILENTLREYFGTIGSPYGGWLRVEQFTADTF